MQGEKEGTKTGAGWGEDITLVISIIFQNWNLNYIWQSVLINKLYN